MQIHLDNAWATIRMRLRLKRISHQLWAEFSAFTRMVKFQMIKEVERPISSDQLQQWLVDEMDALDHRVKEVVRYHSFFYSPPIEWLTDYTPKLNQCVLLATATPPAVIEMSTVATRQYRFPLTWASFTQFRPNISVEMKPLPMPHPLMERRPIEY